jgi:alpha-galactosidase
MAKIALIGAGSVVFTRNLVNDLLSFPALAGSTLVLMDIDARRLALARDLVQTMITARGLPTRVEATLDRTEAVRGAGYVIVTIQVGGLEAYAHDIEIPARYGVSQCVGDTLGPGGVFRGLRTIPVLLDLCREMDQFCAPEALILNYSNPMAINCWAIATTGRPHIGLCHSVQGTSRMLASWIDVPYEEVSYQVAGINHQAWFLQFRHRGQDAYPRLRARIVDPAVIGEEPVRVELMRQFGYFVTESSGHASEYGPYFRKTAPMIDELSARFTTPGDAWLDWGRTGGYLKECRRRVNQYEEQVREQIAGTRPLPAARSDEYGSGIINAIETNEPFLFNGNLPNTGLIPNLPQGCCVEVPTVAKATGLHPTVAGDLPPQLAALNRTNINVQELATWGGVHGDREAVVHALMLDPLTGAVCSLDQIRRLAEDLCRRVRLAAAVGAVGSALAWPGCSPTGVRYVACRGCGVARRRSRAPRRLARLLFLAHPPAAGVPGEMVCKEGRLKHSDRLRLHVGAHGMCANV